MGEDLAPPAPFVPSEAIADELQLMVNIFRPQNIHILTLTLTFFNNPPPKKPDTHISAVFNVTFLTW